MRQQVDRAPAARAAAGAAGLGTAELSPSAPGSGEPGAGLPGAVPVGSGAAGQGIADQRRRQMLTAALDVISERGFADTRIADIAERIGISPALIIYYFKTKDQLLTEAIRHYEDTWYAEGKRRMDALPTAAARIEEFVAMNLLPDSDDELESDWQLWLEFWVQAARNPGVAVLRQKSDERWREALVSLVRSGQSNGEFASLDPHPFSIVVSSLLDGLTIQIALDDPVVDPVSAFELSMQFIAEKLGFEWAPTGRAHANGAGR
ncbi:MAG TPA: TetR family transcriptional regulator C-terminal domain-containing protein [Streptosporangiaceae bacterium]|nr:TetR family transcriptional regulator C-terminal domain-containing protein [Streptosporangiaceae bacterium]